MVDPNPNQKGLGKEAKPSSMEVSATSTNTRREAREKRVQTVLKFLKKLGLPVSGGESQGQFSS